MGQLNVIEGHYDASGLRFAILASRFNDFVVDRLISGSIDCILRHGGIKEDITIVRVAGAMELPLVCKKLSLTSKFDGIVILGAIIRGSTPHFDYVASETTKGVVNVSLQTDVPIGFGVLTTDTIEQAIERAGSKAGNKGAEATLAVLESIRVIQKIS